VVEQFRLDDEPPAVLRGKQLVVELQVFRFRAADHLPQTFEQDKGLFLLVEADMTDLALVNGRLVPDEGSRPCFHSELRFRPDDDGAFDVATHRPFQSSDIRSKCRPSILLGSRDHYTEAPGADDKAKFRTGS